MLAPLPSRSRNIQANDFGHRPSWPRELFSLFQMLHSLWGLLATSWPWFQQSVCHCICKHTDEAIARLNTSWVCFSANVDDDDDDDDDDNDDHDPLSMSLIHWGHQREVELRITDYLVPNPRKDIESNRGTLIVLGDWMICDFVKGVVAGWGQQESFQEKYQAGTWF